MAVSGWFLGAAASLRSLRMPRADEQPAAASPPSTVFALEEGHVAAGPALPPWETPPAAWRPGRVEEWSTLVRELPADDATFLAGVPAGLSQAEAAALSAADWSWDDAQTDSLTPSSVAALQDKRLAAVRLRLVPARCRERNFWSAYWWKLRELGRLTTTAQVDAFLRVANRDPAGARVGAVVEALEAAARARHELEDLAKQCAEELRAASDNAALLRRVGQRHLAGKKMDSRELMDSVFESCKYHKQKVGVLIARLEELPPDKRVAGLGPELMGRLHAANAELGAAITEHRRAGLDTAPGQPDSAGQSRVQLSADCE
eukprot:TRINITY_DN26931_c0_g1_i2.p1 TRINITY_DN26931_c0_g1~~TRINITY_DN26931_c0_g1_i2.p1  ORF type:complete len:341 (+),score=76.71 TRINITY_DN26931_c0_g1_i2:70-1023(+)